MNYFFVLDFDTILKGFEKMEFFDFGPLYNPIKEQSIKFDELGRLILTTISDGDSSAQRINQRIGSVWINDDKAVLQSAYGIKVELRGIQPFCSKKIQIISLRLVG